MKTIFLTFISIFILSVFTNAQSPPDQQPIPLLGDEAPSFEANSTQGLINFPSDYFGKWKIMMSHPADFTPVCSTEILDLAEMQDEFKKLNTQLLVLSTDGINSHLDWIRSLEKIQEKEGRKVGVNFPLVPDVGLEISKQYGMIHSGMSSTKTVRGVFFINPDNKICAIFFYPVSTGRNLEEIKRTLLALQESDKKNVLTPSNWEPGDDCLLESPKSREEAEKLAQKNDPNLYSLDWYIWYKRSK